MLLVSMVILAIIVQLIHPEENFLKWNVIKSNLIFVLCTCVGHACVEEYIFRHLFWKGVKNMDDVPTLIFLNTAIFWMAHLFLLFYSNAIGDNRKSHLYTSTSYNLAVVFLGMVLNAVYLDKRASFPMIRCILLHAIILIVWSVFLGGGDASMLMTYNKEPFAKIGAQLYKAWG